MLSNFDFNMERNFSASLLPTVEELVFDIKRLNTKLEILEGEKSILEKELQISKGVNSKPSEEFTVAFEKMRSEAHRNRTLVVKLCEKYELIKSNFKMERNSMQAIKSQLSNSLNVCAGEYSNAINLLIKALSNERMNFKAQSQELLSQITEKDVQIKSDATSILSHRKTITDLEMRTIKLSKQLNTLKDEYEAKMTLIKDTKNAEYNELQNRLSTLLSATQNELSAAQTKNESLTVTVSTTCIKLNVMTQERNELQKEVDKLRNDNKELTDKVTTLQNKQQSTSQELQTQNNLLQSKLSNSESEVMSLGAKLRDAMSKLERTLQLNETLNNDMKGILSREMSLRSEIGTTNLDKQEVYSRLQSITNKLKTIESDSKIEIEALNNTITALTTENNTLAQETNKYKTMYDELQSYVNILKSENSAKIAKFEQENHLNTATIQKLTTENEKLKQQLLKSTYENNSLVSEKDTIRTERDELAATHKNLQTTNTQLQLSLQATLSQLNDIEKSNLTLTKQLESWNPELLRAANERIAECESEIEGLKYTVRRECEERMELVFEISEYKDQLKRWASGTNKAGNKSSATNANDKMNNMHIGNNSNSNSNSNGYSGGRHSESYAYINNSSNNSNPNTNISTSSSVKSNAYTDTVNKLFKSSSAGGSNLPLHNNTYSSGIVDSIDHTLQNSNHVAENSMENSAVWTQRMTQGVAGGGGNSKKHRRK